jgi:polysaccharide biosynthesis protein PslG
MVRRVVGIMVSVVVAFGCAAGAPAIAGAVTIGIGSGDPSMFSDPRFLALHVGTARTVVPWDVAVRRSERRQLRAFRTWYHAAQAAHVSPLISFGADPATPANFSPTVSQYEHGVTAFLKQFPQIKTYTAWNEPDFSWRALARHPALAANYFNALYKLCRRCTVLAGDVYLPAIGQARINHAIGLLGPWLRAYARGLHHRPAGWALHDYRDVRFHNSAQIRALMSVSSGPIWLDETGGVLHRGTWPSQSAKAAGRDEQYLLTLAKRYHRITHIYHFQWHAIASSGWDSGLIGPTGRPRPAYTVLLNWLRPHRGRK